MLVRRVDVVLGSWMGRRLKCSAAFKAYFMSLVFPACLFPPTGLMLNITHIMLTPVIWEYDGK